MEPKHFESLYPAESRFEEIEKMLGYVRQGNSCQIIALPGVGRSTVLGLLSFNKAVRVKHLGEEEAKYHFVLINFSEIRKRPLLDVTKLIFLNLVDSLRDRQLTDVYQRTLEIFHQAIKINDELVLFQGLKQAIDILSAEKNMRLVFLFDRFEEYVPLLTTEFFAHLRVLRDRAKYSFSVVFSLTRPLEELIEPALMTDFYDFVVGHHVYLPINDQPGLDFRIEYAQKMADKTLDKKVLEQIYELTGRFPRATKFCVQVLLNNNGDSIAPTTRGERHRTKSGLQNDKGVLATFLLNHKSVQRPLYELWRSLTPSERTFLLSEKYTATNPDYAFLAKVDLLREGKLTIPLFEKFMHEYLSQDTQVTLKKEPIILDPETSEIKKGALVLSDTLTSSEYRLLKFLLLNPQRILEREEIISEVWKESASTAGVTDQALDQLIFRVRKKVEEDPNNPTHILTVKGRGLRFSQ